MYKVLVFLLVVFIGSTVGDVRKSKLPSHHINRAVIPLNSGTNGLDWCPQCINTFDDLIQVVLDIILQYGILDTCGNLCNLVVEKTGSELLGFVCNLGCDILGIEEFAKFMQSADIDPIYYCETIKLCPINDNGDAKFKSFAIIPARAEMGSTIGVDMMYVSHNGTGTGEMIVMIQTVDKIPINGGILIEAKKPGTYAERLTIDTNPDPDCDPTQDQCEQWLAGMYNVTVMLCNGQCGSHHPHTALYDMVKGNFTLFEQ